MSITTIFPNSHREIDDQIVFHADDASCLTLRLVSKRAQEVITNPLFQMRFFAQHPYLERFKDKLFITLRNDHSGDCWRVVCDAFSSKRCIASYVSEDLVSVSWGIKKTRIIFPFFANATPSICSSLQSQKAVCESQIREICGFGFEDPNSLIDKEWKVIKAFEDEYLVPLNIKIEEVINTITDGLSDEDKEQLNHLLFWLGNQLFLNGEAIEDFLNKSDEEILPLKRKYIPQYILIIGLIQEMIPMSDKVGLLYACYHGLEIKRVDCEGELQKLNEKISFLTPFFQGSQELTELTDDFDSYESYFRGIRTVSEIESCNAGRLKELEEIVNADYKHFLQMHIESSEHNKKKIEKTLPKLARLLKGDLNLKQKYFNFFEAQQGKIQQELEDAKDIENRAIQYSKLLECSKAIQGVIDNPSTTFPQHIADLINALGVQYSSCIWGDLYQKCANGVHEDRWSEKHFPEFLPKLQKLLKKSLRPYKDLQENQGT